MLKGVKLFHRRFDLVIIGFAVSFYFKNIPCLEPLLSIHIFPQMLPASGAPLSSRYGLGFPLPDGKAMNMANTIAIRDIIRILMMPIGAIFTR